MAYVAIPDVELHPDDVLTPDYEQIIAMVRFIDFLMVGLGGAAGSMLRYGVTLLCSAIGFQCCGGALNLSGNVATFIVNILGSFLIGLLTGCCREGSLLLLLTVGLCGGFTTFSSFSMQNVKLLQDGKIGLALVYIIATVTVCVFMAWLGYRLGQSR